MVLKIRLARVAGPGGSKRHAPIYNIVLAQARSARDSKPLEVLGTYDPIPKASVDAAPGARKHKDIRLDVSRAKYWLGVGAQPTDTAWRILSMIGLLEPRYLPNGEQTENALKAIRFNTMIPQQPRFARLLHEFHPQEVSRGVLTGEPSNIVQEIQDLKEREYGNQLPGSATATSIEEPKFKIRRTSSTTKGDRAAPMGEIKGEATGTTSPQDPNAA